MGRPKGSKNKTKTTKNETKRPRNVIKTIPVPEISNVVDFNIGPQTGLQKNLDKYVQFVSWARWNPDLFLDLCRPQEGGINLSYDQRVFLRCAVRFASMYGCFPRG